MADTLLLRSLKAQPKTLNLCNKNLQKVPKLIGKLENLLSLSLKNNKLCSLPVEIGDLSQVIMFVYIAKRGSVAVL